MKPEPVWYDAHQDEIIIMHGKKAERGCQGITELKYDGKTYNVPDYLSLFLWRVNADAWRLKRKSGWLIKLGNL